MRCPACGKLLGEGELIGELVAHWCEGCQEFLVIAKG